MTNWIKNIIWNGTIKVVTGLHIGGSKESVQIGGTDSPVITTKLLYQDNKTQSEKVIEIPYIPGSSIKGKIRSLLELAYDSSPKKDNILKLFGYAKNENSSKTDNSGYSENESSSKTDNSITRLIVRDAFPTKEWIDKVAKNEAITEIKGENRIDKITSMADPRFIERVVPDVTFELTFIIRIFNGDSEKDFLTLLEEGIRMLEDSYLGGQGSRGYGKIKIEMNNQPEHKTLKEYEPEK